MDKVYSSKTPMIVHALEVDTDPFSSHEGEEELCHEFSYLSVLGALMYLAKNTGPNIAFTVNLLARHSTTPTKYLWNGVKNILRYL
jgi:hypothetical protein